MEREMYSYLEWQLNVDPSMLHGFEGQVNHNFAGPGPYFPREARNRPRSPCLLPRRAPIPLSPLPHRPPRLPPLDVQKFDVKIVSSASSATVSLAMSSRYPPCRRYPRRSTRPTGR